jgi:hypothetical protein
MRSTAFRTLGCTLLARFLPPALIGLALALPACRSSDGSRTRSLVELAQARARWADAGLTSYSLVQRRICFCPPPHEWRMVVVNGQPAFIDQVLDPDVANRAMEQTALSQSMSVEQLFDWIEQQIEGAGTIDVLYDESLGYPAQIDADPVLGAVDDEISWRLGSVAPTGACTEIGCLDAFWLTIDAPSAGFPAGDWTVSVGTWDDFEECSFTLAPGSCGRSVCIESSECFLTFDSDGALRVTLPPVFGIAPLGQVPVGVTVEIDGAEVLSAAVTPTETRWQPNGPLCPPVCWTAAASVALP